MAVEYDLKLTLSQVKMNSSATTLDIGEVARRSGLPASTLRFYEEKGLIQSVGRQGLRRVFSVGVLERLALITLGTNAGFSLEQITSMFTPEGIPQIDRKQLRAKVRQVDKVIQRLTAIRDSLHHAANCPAENHLQCPSFQRLLRIVGKKRKPLPTTVVKPKKRR